MILLKAVHFPKHNLNSFFGFDEEQADGSGDEEQEKEEEPEFVADHETKAVNPEGMIETID